MRRPGASSRSIPSSAQGPSSRVSSAEAPHGQGGGRLRGADRGVGIGDGVGGVDHLEDARRRLPHPLEGLGRARKPGHDLERGQRGEHDHREEHALQPSFVHSGHAEHQRGPHRRAGEQLAETRTDAGGVGRGRGHGGQLGVGGGHTCELARGRAVGHEVRSALDEIDDRDAELAAGGRLAGLGPPSEAAGEPRHQDRGGEQGDGQDEPGGRQQPHDDGDGRRTDDERDAVGREHPQQEILERVDVGHEAGEEIATVERREAGRGETLEPLVDGDPEVGEQAERGVVADEALAVPEQPTGDGEEAHAHHGQAEGGDRGVLGGARDQPPRRRQQCDAGGCGRRAEQRGDDQPPGGGPGDAQRATQGRRSDVALDGR